MNDEYAVIEDSSKALKLELYASELASFVERKRYGKQELSAIAETFEYLKVKKKNRF